jgi:surface antigen
MFIDGRYGRRDEKADPARVRFRPDKARTGDEVDMRWIGLVLAPGALAALVGWSAPGMPEPRWASDAEVQLAGGPPPWAPAHGYRQKHRDYRQSVEIDDDTPDVGILLGRCDRETLGAVLGGVAGGVIGSQVGKGSNRTVATIGGAVIGVIVGGAIGRSMDQVDQACIGQALEQAPVGQSVSWTNPDGGQYRVTPVRTYQAADGRYCREYQTFATIGGRQEQVYGTACRQPDGSWQVQS